MALCGRNVPWISSNTTSRTVDDLDPGEVPQHELRLQLQALAESKLYLEVLCFFLLNFFVKGCWRFMMEGMYLEVDLLRCWFVFFWSCWRFMMEGMKISGWWVCEKTHSFGFTCLNYIQEVTQEALAQNEANGLGPKFWVWFGHICIHAFIEGCDFWSGTIWWSWVRLPWMRWSVFTAVS